MSTHHNPRSKYTISTVNSSQPAHRHHKNHNSDSRRFANCSSATTRHQYHTNSDSSSRSTSNIRTRAEYHYSICATMASTAQNAAPSARSSTMSMHHYYYQTPSHQMPEPEAWLMATPIDDDDLTFGGKPLSAWYEEDRRRFSLGEDSARTMESDEDEEEERGRQRIRAQYDAPSPSHRQHHKSQHSNKSQEKH